MKKISSLSMASLMLTSGLAFAVEPAEGWYAGFMLGGSYAPSQNFTFYTPFLPTIPISSKLTYNFGGNVAGQFGYRCGKFRYEGELLYNINTFDKIRTQGFTLNRNVGSNVFGFSMKGNTSTLAGIFNVYYEFYDESYSDTKWVPYLGLGIGYAAVRNSLNFYHNSTKLNVNDNSHTENSPIGQVMGGINYFFTDNVSLGSDLRYWTTRKIDNFGTRASAASWNLLMNFSFDQPAY